MNDNVNYADYLEMESDCITAPPTNSPPFAPNTPDPGDNAVKVALTDGAVTLSWSGGDPNPWDTVVYDVWFGESAGNLSEVATGLSTTSYTQASLQEGVQYFWKIVTRDDGTPGMETESEVWQFITQAPAPDLVASTISWTPDADIEAGQEVTFTAMIQNATGTGPVVDPFRIEFQMDGTRIGSQQQISQALFAGDTIEVSQTWTASPGVHRITIIADSTSTVTETDEEN
ncbi:MAG: hypothetical protein GY792_24345, partial [Gammaproteobacteria bacterium]|nr:hypothetical protein [Gammaproteobacteria bacterium]